MTSINTKIPGLDNYTDDSDEDSSTGSKAPPPPTQKHFLAIDIPTVTIKVVAAPLNIPNERLSYDGTSALHVYTEEEYQQLGVEVSEEEVEAERDDDAIHCEICDKFYVGCCKEHPLFWIPDRQQQNKEIPAGVERRAEKSKPLFIRIRMSKIPNAGLGAFAEMSIPRGTVFGPYQGVMINDPDKAKIDGYCWEIRTKYQHGFVDGSDERYSNWMRYINHSSGFEEQNAVAFQYQGQIFYRIFRPIEKGEEILVHYGESYGRELYKDFVKTRRLHYAGSAQPPKRKRSPKNPFIL